MAKGYMRISRKIENWGWYRDTNTFRVFFHLLLKAQYQDDGEYMGVTLKRGQVAIGRKKLSTDLGISEQSVRTSLERLSKSQEITIKSTNKFSIITICNYDSWQCDTLSDNQQNNQQLTNENDENQPTTNHIQINKEIEEYKKEIERLKEELAKASEKKKKASPVRKSLGGKAQDLFVDFYKEKGFSDTDYYWSPKDGSNMKQLLAKIRSAREGKGLPCDDDSMLSALKSLLESITDKWILEHFDVSNINSKYNEIVASAKNSGYKSGMDVGRIVQYDKSKFEGVTSENFFKK